MGLMGSNAFADSIIQTGSFGPSTTDFSWTINVNKFVLPVGYHVTGITMEITGAAASNPFTLTNNAAGTQTFGAYFATAIGMFSNSADSTGVGAIFSMPVFTSGGAPPFGPAATITLGGNLAPVPCANNTPSAACNSVSYTTASGSGTTGLINVSSGNWANYLGIGTVTFGGLTNSTTTFNGGGGNINLAQTTTASVGANLVFNYALDEVPGVPEPATMTLMGVALLGIGLLRKRIRQ